MPDLTRTRRRLRVTERRLADQRAANCVLEAWGMDKAQELNEVRAQLARHKEENRLLKHWLQCQSMKVEAVPSAGSRSLVRHADGSYTNR